MTYSGTRRLLLEAVPLLLLIVLPLSVHAGVLATVFGALEKNKTGEMADVQEAGNAQTFALLKAAVNTDPRPAVGGGDVIVDAGSLVPQPVNEETIQEEGITSGQITIYTVKPEGDTLSQIADMFDVSVNTIMWANDISDPDLIRPGDELLILPITGVRHVVKDGDTIRSIAKKYGDEENLDEIVQEIVEYNKLASVDSISVGDTVVVPGGEVPTQQQRTYATPVKTSGGSSVASSGGSADGFSHPLPGGVRSQGLHGYNGIDFAAPAGTQILAAAPGTVIVAKHSGWNGGYGLYVVVKHANGTQTLYAHNSANLVSVGDYVSTGQAVARVGSTGRSTGNHLHFEVRGARNPF